MFDRNGKITQILILKHPLCQKDSDWIWKRQERDFASPRNADSKREVRRAQAVPERKWFPFWFMSQFAGLRVHVEQSCLKAP